MNQIQNLKNNVTGAILHVKLVIAYYSSSLSSGEKTMLSVWSFCFVGGLLAIAFPVVTFKPLIALLGFIVGFSLLAMMQILEYKG